MRGERRDGPELETVERHVPARRGAVARIVIAQVQIGGREGDTVLRDEGERARVELMAHAVLTTADAPGHVRELHRGQVVRKLRPDVDQLDIGGDRSWCAFGKIEPQAHCAFATVHGHRQR